MMNMSLLDNGCQTAGSITDWQFQLLCSEIYHCFSQGYASHQLLQPIMGHHRERRAGLLLRPMGFFSGGTMAGRPSFANSELPCCWDFFLPLSQTLFPCGSTKFPRLQPPLASCLFPFKTSYHPINICLGTKSQLRTQNQHILNSHQKFTSLLPNKHPRVHFCFLHLHLIISFFDSEEFWLPLPLIHLLLEKEWKYFPTMHIHSFTHSYILWLPWFGPKGRALLKRIYYLIKQNVY